MHPLRARPPSSCRTGPHGRTFTAKWYMSRCCRLRSAVHARGRAALTCSQWRARHTPPRVCSFLLENYRQDYVVGLFAGGFERPALLAASPPIRVAQPELPLQGRVTLTGRPGEAVVQWTAGAPAATVRAGRRAVSAANGARHEVLWGLKSGRYTRRERAGALTYARDEMCGAPASAVRRAALRSHLHHGLEGQRRAARRRERLVVAHARALILCRRRRPHR